MARKVKCKWCKNPGDKENMHVESKHTGRFNQNGTEKVINSYYHHECVEAFEKDKAFKENERIEFDNLYQYLLKLHGIEMLDKRMIERIQDVRNGTVKMGNQKMVKSKQGIEYGNLLEAYRYLQTKIDHIIHTNVSLQKAKWNEFTYILGTVLRSYNDVQHMLKQKEKEEVKQRVVVEKNLVMSEEDSYTDLTYKKKKKDNLDISSFL